MRFWAMRAAMLVAGAPAGGADARRCCTGSMVAFPLEKEVIQPRGFGLASTCGAASSSQGATKARSPCAVATAAGLDVRCDDGGGVPADGAAGDAVVMLRNRTADADAAAGHAAARGPFVDGDGGRRAAGGGAAAAAAVAASRAHGKRNRHNVDGFALTYADIERLYGGPRLAKKLRALARRFGYDPR